MCPNHRFNKMLSILVTIIAAVCFSAICDATTPPGLAPELFSTVAAHDGLKAPDEPTVIRTRFVHVDIEFLGSIQTPAEAVHLDLFTDANFTALFERSETNYLGSFAWVGRLEGVTRSTAILVVTGGELAGSVSLPGAHFEIRSVGGGVHAIHEIDQSAFPPEMHGIHGPESLTLSRYEPARAPDTCQEILVLVPYSPEARAAAGGTAAIQNLVALAVTETNQSYVNSGLTQRIALAYTLETLPGDATNNFNTDLNALRVLTDGVFENVDEAREDYNADVVGLIIENSSSCGLGYLNSSEATAFSVTHRTCATGYYSFGHELGHNMSARHDWYVDDCSSASCAYRKGFVNVADQWRTVMAYNRLCADSGTSCTRLPYWSNPDVTYGGDSMGVIYTGPTNCIEDETTPDPSTCAADNRRALNDTCSTVSNFRIGAAGEVFTDGFESGDTGEWSSTQPAVP
ncbi:MAG: hypothetical protein GY906_00820 [bacterium]|nr:hypothetical protein [bacterium]